MSKKSSDNYIEASDSHVVYVTVPNELEAKSLAKGAIEEKLAACVNIVPGITSVYLWEGKVCEDGELLLIIKTCSSKIEALHAFIREKHSYDTPEFITLPVMAGSAAYLHWMKQSLRE